MKRRISFRYTSASDALEIVIILVLDCALELLSRVCDMLVDNNLYSAGNDVVLFWVGKG